MDPVTFCREDNKYSALWSDGYKDANWKRLARVAMVAVKTYVSPRLIDFGFGKGSAMEFFDRKGARVTGVDISSHAVVEQLKIGRDVRHTSLDDLPMFADNQFDIGFSNDVLEHLPEECVERSLDEMTRVCSGYLFVSVCPTPSHHKSLEGENLHLTVKPAEWWEQKFEKYGGAQRIKFLFSRSLRYVLQLHYFKKAHNAEQLSSQVSGNIDVV